MSTIFKALQKKSGQNQEQGNETVKIIREKKAGKKSFLIFLVAIPVLTIAAAFAYYGYEIISLRTDQTIETRQEEIVRSEPHAPPPPPERSPDSPIFTPQPIEDLHSSIIREREEEKEDLTDTETSSLSKEKKVQDSEKDETEPVTEPEQKEEEKVETEREEETEAPGPEEPEQELISSFDLQGVAGDDDGFIAIINDRIIGEGEMVDGAMVLSISSDYVELEKNGQRFQITQ